MLRCHNLMNKISLISTKTKNCCLKELNSCESFVINKNKLILVVLVLLCWWSCPVLLDCYKYLFFLIRSFFMVSNSCIPLHFICNALHLRQHIYIVAQNYTTLRTQNPVHLQKNVLHTTSVTH